MNYYLQKSEFHLSVLVGAYGSFANAFLLATCDKLHKSHSKARSVASGAALSDDVF